MDRGLYTSLFLIFLCLFFFFFFPSSKAETWTKYDLTTVQTFSLQMERRRLAVLCSHLRQIDLGRPNMPQRPRSNGISHASTSNCSNSAEESEKGSEEKDCVFCMIIRGESPAFKVSIVCCYFLLVFFNYYFGNFFCLDYESSCLVLVVLVFLVGLVY